MHVEVDNEEGNIISLLHAVQVYAIQMYGIMHNVRSTRTIYNGFEPGSTKQTKASAKYCILIPCMYGSILYGVGNRQLSKCILNANVCYNWPF